MIKFFSVRAILLAGAMTSALALTAACGGDDDASSPTKPAATIQSGGTTAPSGATTAPSNGEVKEIEVELADNVFKPKELTVPVNTPLEFEVKNTGKAIHNMHILSKDKEGKDFTSAQMVNPGDDNKFQATFTKKGTYNFQCDFHMPDMVGTITVN